MKNAKMLLAFAASIATISVLPNLAYADEYVYSYTGLPFTGNQGPSPIEGSVDVELISNGPIVNTQLFSNSYLFGADFLSWTVTGGYPFDALSSSNLLASISVQIDTYSGSVFDWSIEATGPEGGSNMSSYFTQINTQGNIYDTGCSINGAADFIYTEPYVREPWSVISEGAIVNNVGSWAVTAVPEPSTWAMISSASRGSALQAIEPLAGARPPPHKVFGPITLPSPLPLVSLLQKHEKGKQLPSSAGLKGLPIPPSADPNTSP